MAEQATLSGIRNHELLEIGYKFDLGEVIKSNSERWFALAPGELLQRNRASKVGDDALEP
jgi:hypothetical protein